MNRCIRRAMLVPCFVAAGCSSMATHAPNAPLSPVRTASTATLTAPSASISRGGDPDQRFSAALKLMRDHQSQEAQAALLALARDFPGFSGPLTDLGILYAQGHQRTQAIAGLTKAVAANPRNAVAWNWLGSLYRESSDDLHAEQSYLQALAVRPDYAAAHLNLGILYEVSMKRPQDALYQYREYLKTAGKEDLIVLAWIRQLESSSTTTVASGTTP